MPKRYDKKRIFYAVMTLLIAIVIFLVSDISSPLGVKTGFNPATLYHFGVFFMFTFFLSLTLINKKASNKIIIIILLLSLIYAISDEFHQLFVPGRFSSLKDMAFDFAGTIYSILFIKVLSRLNKL